jgi:hypothetical protein
VFVAWDFADDLTRTLLAAAAKFGLKLATGEPVEWRIPGLTVPASGLIGVDVVARELASADLVLALVDRPNANVGWEAGLGMGFGKPIRFGTLAAAKAPWTRQGPMAGLYVQLLEGWQDLIGLIGESPDWNQPKLAPPVGPGKTVVLCPDGPEGSGLRTFLELEMDGLHLAHPMADNLGDFVARMADCTRLIWIVCGQPDPDARDGRGNAGNSILAGLARGQGLPVDVFRSRSARNLADVAGEGCDFDGFDDLRRQLVVRLAPTDPIATDRTPLLAGPPILVPEGVVGARLQQELERLFPAEPQIRKLARLVGVETLMTPGTPDQLWGDLLRQLRNRRGDLRVILETACAAEPHNRVLSVLLSS